MDYSRIPKELKKLKQWVCTWDNSKIPMRVFERKAASSTAPETWGTFQQAKRAVETGFYDNLGFVFAENGIVGIDIDIGFENGLMTPICADIIKACNSYTEKSKSGRGVHIFLRGNIPFAGRNNLKGIEIYKSKRFFITTGKVVIFDKMIENQEAIDYVLGKYFSDSLKRSNKADFSSTNRIYSPKFKAPKNGKISPYPEYPEISAGGRNISLTSLAGIMWNTGFSENQIYKELSYVNKTKCSPPLNDWELQLICKSITKYRR